MIILDSNFIIYAVKYRLIDEVKEKQHEYGKIVVPKQVLAELEKQKRAAEFSIAEKFPVKRIFARNADSAILKMAKKGDVVATMDRMLGKKLKNTCKIMVIRNKKKISVL